MSFSNLLPRSPWTPPHQPASRDNQPASPYSKRQAARASQPVIQQQVAPLPEQGQGTMTLVQRRNSPSVYSLLPLPRYEQHSAQRPKVVKRGRPLRPADALARQLEGYCLPGDYVGSSFASAAGAVGISGLFPPSAAVLPEEPASGAPRDAVDPSAGSVAGASAEGAR